MVDRAAAARERAWQLLRSKAQSAGRRFRQFVPSLVMLITTVAMSANLMHAAHAGLLLRKTVDIVTPEEGQLVTFEVTAANEGSTELPGVVVKDILPPGLVIPDGLAVFTSTGEYQAAQGLWTVGDLEPEATAVMTMPAIALGVPGQHCLVNIASSQSPGLPLLPVEAAVAVRAPGAESCNEADLSVNRIYSPGTYLQCSPERNLSYTFSIVNNGPQEARNVVFQVTETAYRAPGFELVSPGCDGLRCQWASIPPAGAREVSGQTGLFVTEQTIRHEVTASVTSSDADFVGSNNTRSHDEVVYPYTGTCGSGLPDYEGALDALGDAAAGQAGPCAIATAAYGTPFDERIERLRDFRDNTLAKSEPGRRFIDWYYRHSPSVAAYVESHSLMQLLVRALLIPILMVISYPVVSLLTVLLVLVALLVRLRARRSHRPSECRDASV